MKLLQKLKRQAKIAIRTTQDIRRGDYKKFCQISQNHDHLLKNFTLSQEIKPSSTFENKVHNLQLASEKINQFIILPKQIFSFWHIVGNPEHGFKSSRSIIKGKTVEEIGGGICQVSGIVYLTAISAGLKVLERYPHSLDLYTDETRFTPLGTDATVVYGYKDLRFYNPYDFPIQFELSIEQAEKSFIHSTLLSGKKIEQKQLILEQKAHETFTEVWVYDENRKLINHSNYLKLNN